MRPTASASPAQPVIDIEAGSMYAAPSAAPHAEAAPTAVDARGSNGSSRESNTSPSSTVQGGGYPTNGSRGTANGSARATVDFVSEDDVRRAIQKGEKIYVNARTIITPSARDIGDPAEVFAKG
jgi:hypothetical protein